MLTTPVHHKKLKVKYFLPRSKFGQCLYNDLAEVYPQEYKNDLLAMDGDRRVEKSTSGL